MRLSINFAWKGKNLSDPPLEDDISVDIRFDRNKNVAFPFLFFNSHIDICLCIFYFIWGYI